MGVTNRSPDVLNAHRTGERPIATMTPAPEKTPVIAIVGQTAVGKSSLAMRLAKLVGGEIVSADSRQVYRRMDIGTAKPPPEHLAAVPHHLIDVADPDDEYSLAVFLQDARKAIQNVNTRSGLPILAGGTGQYVWGLLEGWNPAPVAPDPRLRAELETRLESEGVAALHRELAERAPEAAARVDARNPRRVVRAIEVVRAKGEGTTPHTRRTPPPYRVAILGLAMDADALRRRIDDRVDAMLAAGWVDEVRGLLDSGYGPELPSMSSLGYREIADHLRGRLTLDEAADAVKRGTRRFARRQRAWFKPADPRIRWFDADTERDEALRYAEQWLNGLHPA